MTAAAQGDRVADLVSLPSASRRVTWPATGYGPLSVGVIVTSLTGRLELRLERPAELTEVPTRLLQRS